MCNLQDSLIYHVPDGAAGPSFSRDSSIGNLKDELDGGVGTLFSSAGAKSYALTYKTRDGVQKSIVRAKGLSLSSTASHIVTPSAFSQLAVSHEPIRVPQRQFRRRAFHTTDPITTVQFEKVLQFTDFKRIREEGYFTRPIGCVLP